MGTLNYLVNHDKMQIFALGKALDAHTIASLCTETALFDHIFNRYQSKDFNLEDPLSRATLITESMVKTIGLTGNQGMTDASDCLFEEYGSYLVVGSVYDADEDVGKTYRGGFMRLK